MATTFSLVTESSADAATLFDLSLDIDIHLESMTASQEQAIDGVISGRIGLGETVTWRARHFGIWFTMTSRITALDAPRRFVDEQVRGPFKIFRHEHTFHDTTDGSRMVDSFIVASPVFGAFAERLVLVPYLRRLITKRNQVILAAASRPLP